MEDFILSLIKALTTTEDWVSETDYDEQTTVWTNIRAGISFKSTLSGSILANCFDYSELGAINRALMDLTQKYYDKKVLEMRDMFRQFENFYPIDVNENQMVLI